MMRHNWTIACRFSMASQETNNVSLLEIVEELTIPAQVPIPPSPGLFPALFDIVTLWSRENDNHGEFGYGKVSLVCPDGSETFGYEYEVDLREKGRFRHVGRMFGLPAQQAGRYHFRVMQRTNQADDWRECGSFPLWVNVFRPEQPGQDRDGST